jgi:hypothetical protein
MGCGLPSGVDREPTRAGRIGRLLRTSGCGCPPYALASTTSIAAQWARPPGLGAEVSWGQDERLARQADAGSGAVIRQSPLANRTLEEANIKPCFDSVSAWPAAEINL